MKCNSRSKLLRVVGLAVLLSYFGVEAIADDHVYNQNDDGSWSKIGVIYTKDGQRSFKCVAGDCMLARCGFCHSNRVDMDAYAMGSADKHSTVYYPRAKLALSDSQKVKFGTIVVSQSGGKLYLHDSTGRKFQLPTGAIIVNGRDGKPAFLTYSGDVAPTLVR